MDRHPVIRRWLRLDQLRSLTEGLRSRESRYQGAAAVGGVGTALVIVGVTGPDRLAAILGALGVAYGLSGVLRNRP